MCLIDRSSCLAGGGLGCSYHKGGSRDGLRVPDLPARHAETGTKHDEIPLSAHEPVPLSCWLTTNSFHAKRLSTNYQAALRLQVSLERWDIEDPAQNRLEGRMPSHFAALMSGEHSQARAKVAEHGQHVPL